MEGFYIPGSQAIAWHKWLAEFHPEVTAVLVQEPHATEVQMWWADFIHYQEQQKSKTTN